MASEGSRSFLRCYASTCVSSHTLNGSVVRSLAAFMRFTLRVSMSPRGAFSSQSSSVMAGRIIGVTGFLAAILPAA